MFKGEYKTKTAQGTPITYMIGDSVVYQGKIYTAVNQTQKSPLQSPKDWKYIGLTEPVQGSSSPLLPEENQFWVDQSNNLYIRKDGLNPVWQTISGSASGSSGSGITYYVSSVNGETGAVTNIAKTNIDNNFTASQTISCSSGSIFVEDLSTSNYISLNPNTSTITCYIDNFGLGSSVSLQFNSTGSPKTVSVPAENTTLAGLNLLQTFTGTNTFTQRTNFNAGISSAGGTFSSDIFVNSMLVGRGGGNIASNVAVGGNALIANSSGTANLALGQQALQANTTASNNTAVGRRALSGVTQGSLNTAVGASTLLSFIGNNATVIGALSGTQSTGTGCVYVGANITGTNNSDKEIIIGEGAVGLGSNTAVLGRTTQVSAHIYGILNLPNGLSASGGTFSENISAPNIVNSLKGWFFL